MIVTWWQECNTLWDTAPMALSQKTLSITGHWACGKSLVTCNYKQLPWWLGHVEHHIMCLNHLSICNWPSLSHPELQIPNPHRRVKLWRVLVEETPWLQQTNQADHDSEQRHPFSWEAILGRHRGPVLANASTPHHQVLCQLQELTQSNLKLHCAKSKTIHYTTLLTTRDRCLLWLQVQHCSQISQQPPSSSIFRSVRSHMFKIWHSYLLDPKKCNCNAANARFESSNNCPSVHINNLLLESFPLVQNPNNLTQGFKSKLSDLLLHVRVCLLFILCLGGILEALGLGIFGLFPRCLVFGLLHHFVHILIQPSQGVNIC